MNKQDIPPEKKALMHDLEQKVIIRTALVWQKGGGDTKSSTRQAYLNSLTDLA